MLKTRTQENNTLRIFFMKYTDYVMKIIESQMTLDKLEVTKTRRYFIDSSGTNQTKLVTYR